MTLRGDGSLAPNRLRRLFRACEFALVAAISTCWRRWPLNADNDRCFLRHPELLQLLERLLLTLRSSLTQSLDGKTAMTLTMAVEALQLQVEGLSQGSHSCA